MFGLFEQFQTFAVARILSDPVAESDSLAVWRARILFGIVFSGLAIGLIAITPVFFLALKENTWELPVVGLMMWMCGLILLIARRPRYKIRAGLISLFFYFIGMNVIFSVGPLSGGPAYLFSFAVLTAILLGRRSALVAVGLNAISLAVIAWLIQNGTIGRSFPLFTTTEAMIAAGVNFLTLNLIVALSIAVLVKGLNAIYLNEKSLTEKLEKEQEQLLKAKKDLEIEADERISAENALRNSEEKFRNAFHTSPDSININRMEDGVYVDINEGFSAITGYTREDVIGRSSLDLHIWHDPKDRETLVAGLRQKGYVNNLQAKFRSKNGRVITALMSASIIMIGDTPHILSITRDIDSWIKAEEALKESEKNFRELAELLPETIFETNIQGYVTFVNRRAYEQFLYTPQDIENGFSAFDIVDTLDRQRAIENSERILNGEHIGISEYLALRKDGSKFPALIQASAIIRDGIPDGLRGFVIDITEKKLIEAQLQQAQKMEAIGTLAGGIAHDFNNILAPIIGFSEICIADMDEGSPHRRNAIQILNAAMRARDLVKQILAFSRQNAQEKKPVQVRLIIKEALNLLKASIPSTITIHQQIDSSSVIEGDPTQIHQVIMNLCTNAYHAMEEKGGNLTVALADTQIQNDGTGRTTNLSPGKYLKLSVSDTGRGIEPGLQDRIFEPYFTTKEKDKGTGMGLSVVHGIVKSHNGHITVDSRPGSGTIFTVYLPMMFSELQPIQRASGLDLPMGSGSVLFVDDEEAIVQMMKQALERLGYHTTGHTSSMEMLADFKKNPEAYDLVITDFTMPDMTGEELARKIKKIRPETPIILCTGFSERMSRIEAKALGIRSFLMKPVILEDLAKTVQQVLAQPQN